MKKEILCILAMLTASAVFAEDPKVMKSGPVTQSQEKSGDSYTVSGTRTENWKLNKDAACSASGCSNASVTVNTETTGAASGTLADANTAFTLEIHGTASRDSDAPGGIMEWKVIGTDKGYFVDPPRLTLARYGQNGQVRAFNIDGSTVSLRNSSWRFRPLDGSWTAMESTPSSLAINANVFPSGQFEFEGTDPASGKKDSAFVDVYEMKVVSGNKTIDRNTPEKDRFLFISGAPAMPEIKIVLLGGKKTAQAELKAEYSLRYRSLTTSGEATGSSSLDNPWLVEMSSIRGGRAVVSAEIDNVRLPNLIFYIRGLNPDAAQVAEYLGSKNAPWYALPIGKHETGLKQMNPVSDSKPPMTDNVAGLPNEAGIGDGGVGMFQMTNPAPTADSVWDWRANADQALSLMAQKRSSAASLLATQRRNAQNAPITASSVGGIVFQDNNPNARPVIDACTIKMYNGAATWDDSKKEKYVGNKLYAEWNYDEGKWDFFPINCYPKKKDPLIDESKDPNKYIDDNDTVWVKNPYLEKVCNQR